MKRPTGTSSLPSWASRTGWMTVFERFFKRLSLPNLLQKTDYHVLAGLVSKDKLDPEVTAKLDAIAAVAQKARPNGE